MSAHTLLRTAFVLTCAAAISPTTMASAQQKPPAATRPAPRQQTAIRGFGDLGLTRFAAGETFDVTLGSSTGLFVGGGVEVVTPRRLFFNVHLSHFQKSGERVFVDDGEVFPLGIDMNVGITPIEVTAGYRLQPRGRTRSVIPYVGGGIGWHRYSETSDFAESGEDVHKTFTGYHALGGVEFRRGRLFAISGEAQWTVVPDALGTGVSSASELLGESNLGGLSVRVRVVVGR